MFYRIDFKKIIIKLKGEVNNMDASLQALDVSKWFIKKDLDTPRNRLDGNKKLQKLLYFSQLIHLANYQEPLFKDDMYAFKHGTVVESVRREYQNCNHRLVNEAMMSKLEFNEKQENTLNIAIDIFGNLNASELSELNHEQEAWRIYFEESNNSGWYNKNDSIIPIEEIIERDIVKVKEMLNSYNNNKSNKNSFIELNDKKFYYDPSEIKINDDIIRELSNFKGQDSSYSIYFDEDAGLVIY